MLTFFNVQLVLLVPDDPILYKKHTHVLYSSSFIVNSKLYNDSVYKMSRTCLTIGGYKTNIENNILKLRGQEAEYGWEKIGCFRRAK